MFNNNSLLVEDLNISDFYHDGKKAWNDFSGTIAGSKVKHTFFAERVKYDDHSLET